MKKVTFVPRHVAAGMLPPAGAVLVSIHDREEPELDVSSAWAEVLYLRFHDADIQCPGFELFSREQARRCIDFVARHADDPGCPELVIHCQLGQSRSAGMALFFSELLDLPCYKQDLPVSAGTYKVYNRKVYATLHAERHGDPGQAFASMHG